MPLHIADEAAIKSGKTTDVYFERTAQILRARNIHKQVVMEVRAGSLPSDYQWAVLAGIEEVATLLTGLPVTAYAMPEGALFHAGEPVLWVRGDYLDFGRLETALLGCLCHASGIATKAARCKQAAGDRPLLSFGARRAHPAIAPMVERNAYIGGCDGVATVEAARLLGEPPVGTMPHALTLILGSARDAFAAFDEVMDPSVPRVCLVDTLCDEKFEALVAAELLGDRLSAVRLDTPASRRGNIVHIAQEVRWELALRGYKNVRIFLSGGVNEEEIARTREVIDAYGVGTAISNARVIDFAMDIVELDGKPFAKRGKESGVKQVLRCPLCGARKVVPWGTVESPCACPADPQPLLSPFIEDGRLARTLPSPQQTRAYVLEQLKRL